MIYAPYHIAFKILNTIEETSKRTGLVNSNKTKTIRTNANQNTPIMINNACIEDVVNFTYFGSIISTSGGTDEDIQARKKKAS